MELELKSGDTLLIDESDWQREFTNYTKNGTAYRFRPCDLTWYVHNNRGKLSVVSCVCINGKNHRYTVYLSKLLCESRAGEHVHYANGNPLDNTRDNLIVRAFRQQHKKKTKTDNPYKGVTKSKERYEARINYRGKQIKLASCESALEAAFCFDDAAREYYGELAILNFPERRYRQRVMSRTTARCYKYSGSFNPVIDAGNVIKVELYCGKIFAVNRSDWFEERTGYKQNGDSYKYRACDLSWQITKKGYVMCSNGSRLLLHRLVTGCPQDRVVDHIDGNKLNNTRSNLRICTNAENLRNQRKGKPKTCKYKGVFCAKGKSYRVTIQANHKVIKSGKHKTALEAALAYDKLALELHGEFACLNFPEKHRAKAVA